MANQHIDKQVDQDDPLDPAVERVRRKLVRFMAINLGLLFLAVMAVVLALVYRASQTPPEEEIAASGPFAEQAQIVLPAGARILGHTLDGNRMMIDVELPGQQRAFFLYDLAQGRMAGRYEVTEQAQ